MRAVFLVLAILAVSRISIHAQRVISLAPSVTETIYFLGGGSNVIAVSRQCNYPRETDRLPRIGDMGNVDLERIVSLRPDLVIASASGNSREQVERLSALGIPVVTLAEKNTVDILTNIRIVGNLLGLNPEPAVKACRKMMLLADAASASNRTRSPKTLVLLSVLPFFSVSTNSFIGDVLERAGLNNVVRTDVRYPQLGQEEILQLNPELVLVSDRFRREEPALKKIFDRLKLKTRIVFFPEDTFSRPGPRVFGMIAELSRLRPPARR